MWTCNDDSKRIIDPDASGLEAAESQASLTGMELPLNILLDQAVTRAMESLGVEKPSQSVPKLGARWHAGKVMLHPSDSSLQPKEVPMDVFFHKIVMMRNNLRVMEQKINANEKLSDADKVELQAYLTRCYGSMTTFNILFKDREDFFSGAA